MPYFHSLTQNFIPNDEITCPQKRGCQRILQSLEMGTKELPAWSPDIQTTEHLWDQLGCAVCSRVTNTTAMAVLRLKLKPKSQVG